MHIKRRNELKAREFHLCEARQSGSTSNIFQKHVHASLHMARDKASEACSVEKELIPFSSFPAFSSFRPTPQKRINIDQFYYY